MRRGFHDGTEPGVFLDHCIFIENGIINFLMPKTRGDSTKTGFNGINTMVNLAKAVWRPWGRKQRPWSWLQRKWCPSCGPGSARFVHSFNVIFRGSGLSPLSCLLFQIQPNGLRANSASRFRDVDQILGILSVALDCQEPYAQGDCNGSQKISGRSK